MLENVRLAFQGIWSHKLRSFLTMLGIIIGIAAIIAIVSTIKGSNEQIRRNLIGSGNNTVSVILTQGGYEWSNDDYSSNKTTIPQVSDDILAQILELKEVERVSTYISKQVYDGVFYGNTSVTSVYVYGVDTTYFETAGYTLKSGRNFMDDDFHGFRANVILDTTAVSNLFGEENPLGKSIEISSVPFTVIGVVTEKNNFEPTINTIDDYYAYMSDDRNGMFFIPKATWPVIYKYDQPENVVVKATSTDTMTKAGQKTERLLNSRLSDTTSSNAVKYSAVDLASRASSIQQLQNTTNMQLVWIAGISLLVGGIGVANIMLVSVAERTNEIGLKKAVGAKNGAILAQFLTEAAVLTTIGGILGVAGGIGTSQVIHYMTGMPVAIDITFSVIAVAISTLLGLFFGIVPSMHAANLDPITALGRE